MTHFEELFHLIHKPNSDVYKDLKSKIEKGVNSPDHQAKLIQHFEIDFGIKKIPPQQNSYSLGMENDWFKLLEITMNSALPLSYKTYIAFKLSDILFKFATRDEILLQDKYREIRDKY